MGSSGHNSPASSEHWRDGCLGEAFGVNARFAGEVCAARNACEPGEAACVYVAERQHRLITHRQAVACGLGAKAIKARVRTRAWVPVHRGVYLIGADRPTNDAGILAAHLATGPTALPSHTTAAWLYGVVPRLERLIHLTVPAGGHRRKLTGVQVHRSGYPLTPRWHRGIPVTPPVDTLIDLAGVLPPDRLEAATAKAFVDHLTSRASLTAAVRAAGKRKGIATFREILARDPKLTRSQNERAFLALVRAAELPEPQTNIVIEGKEVDAYWHDAKLAVEIDAYATHGDRATFEDDHLLDVDFEAAGIKLLRFTDTRIKNHPHAVVARLAASLALRLGGLPAPRRRR